MESPTACKRSKIDYTTMMNLMKKSILENSMTSKSYWNQLKRDARTKGLDPKPKKICQLLAATVCFFILDEERNKIYEKRHQLGTRLLIIRIGLRKNWRCKNLGLQRIIFPESR